MKHLPSARQQIIYCQCFSEPKIFKALHQEFGFFSYLSNYFCSHVSNRPRALRPMRQGKLRFVHYYIERGSVGLQILKLTSVFHHLPSVHSKQLCALALLGHTTKQVLPSYVYKQNSLSNLYT